MEKRNITRKDIEEKLVSVGDYVKMDYLQKCLKMQLDFDTRKFALNKLAAIYESRKMYLEAARLIRIAADINATYEAKINDFVKSLELFIKGGNFSEADITLAKALGTANERQKVAIKLKTKEVYKAQAQEYLSRDKRKHACETYEKLLGMDLNPLEKKEVQEQLLFLYNKLGKIIESGNLRKSMSQPSTSQQPQEERRRSSFSFREMGLDD
ncbi:MAG: hypothetical protein AABY00_00960 [Nanoarchaeota archaeon]|mgnify:CR=1 FL=1